MIRSNTYVKRNERQPDRRIRRVHAGIAVKLIPAGHYGSSSTERLQKLQYELRTWIKDCPRPVLVLDFGQAVNPGAALLGLLAQSTVQAQQLGKRIVVCGSHLPELIDVTGLDRIISAFPTREAAIRHLTVPKSVVTGGLNL